MTKKNSSANGSDSAARRDDRLKAALKANLARRKTQVRARQAQTDAKAMGDEADHEE